MSVSAIFIIPGFFLGQGGDYLPKIVYICTNQSDFNMQFFHGSSAEPFGRFSLDHALEGDGKVKFGWGVYVTEKYSTAAHYAFNKRRPENKDFYVYTVEIPDRTPDNCLSLLKGVPVAESIVRRVEAGLGGPVPREACTEGIPFRKYLANKLTGKNLPVKKMIGKATVEGEKAASEFLCGLGVDLIEWPYDWKKPEAEKNMAVLDDKKVRIVRIEKVELDPKGHRLIEGSQQIIKEF